ncbi:DNA replication and repair protein RecO [Acetitomaculum ruminis DSM 5522]|uniref:DNA repair protein RecO n=1 Tax=Acetitomaculum ruminis DSM 5522 TaxID=1120918 RepID=A0A1I0V2D7_9FIRM|nr:DNA repair protein RecO [Acetitomaculum ruminis]SFA70451.1 DNA replication and repair protein RecO [Acetitomaculum ruminis DSM 5522]
MDNKITLKGMIIKVSPVGEKGKRLVLLTLENGKVTVFANNAKKAGSSLLAATNPFVFGSFEVYQGKNSYTLLKADIDDYFLEISENLDRTYYGFYFLEICDYYCKENNDETEVLKLLYQSIKALCTDKIEYKLIRRIFELKLLVLNGEYPNVFSCVECGTKENLLAFSIRKDGCICKECAKLYGEDSKLLEATIYTMQFIVCQSIAKLYTFRVSEQVLLQLEKIMDQYLRKYINYEKLNSYRFLS